MQKVRIYPVQIKRREFLWSKIGLTNWVVLSLFFLRLSDKVLNRSFRCPLTLQIRNIKIVFGPALTYESTRPKWTRTLELNQPKPVAEPTHFCEQDGLDQTGRTWSYGSYGIILSYGSYISFIIWELQYHLSHGSYGIMILFYLMEVTISWSYFI